MRPGKAAILRDGPAQPRRRARRRRGNAPVERDFLFTWRQMPRAWRVEMPLPGFTAEAALQFRSTRTYRSFYINGATTSQGIAPQLGLGPAPPLGDVNCSCITYQPGNPNICTLWSGPVAGDGPEQAGDIHHGVTHACAGCRSRCFRLPAGTRRQDCLDVCPC